MSPRMNKFADFIYRRYPLRVLATMLYLAPKRVCDSSYYPEEKRKSGIRRYFEILWASVKTGDYGKFYNAYGFDLKNSPKKSDYMLEPEFWKKIIPLNYIGAVNYSLVLRDKFVFWSVLSRFGIPTPEVLAYCKNGRYYHQGHEVTREAWWSALRNRGECFFLKATNDACARSVWRIEVKDDGLFADGKVLDAESTMVEDGAFLAQSAVANCELLSAIQPNSVNTLRIVTLSDGTGDIKLLSPGGLRVGGGGAVDNWAAGGLFVGITKDGCLQKYGFYKPGKTKFAKSSCQPQTGFVFDGVKLPYYDDAVALVKKAHAILSEVRTIGWDVALTPTGPVIIEGNDNWEISLMQIVAGGLKNRLECLINEDSRKNKVKQEKSRKLTGK